jgi:hypothetical protein
MTHGYYQPDMGMRGGPMYRTGGRALALKKVAQQTGFKTLINQSKNVELKENAHLLLNQVAQEEQKL